MKFLSTFLFIVISVSCAFAQVQTGVDDSTEIQPGIYDRPTFATIGNLSIGGFVEGNTNSFEEEGTPEGFSFEFRRFNIFLSSDVSDQLQLLSEIEFEHGTENIFLKRALLDFEFHQAFVVRGGIFLVPIGAYNVNSDGPMWEFVERPLVSTEIIPTTLSEVGVGIHGQFTPGITTVSYDAYLTNGLGDRIVLNDFDRTRLASGRHEDQFMADNNGIPAYSGRLAVRNHYFGEIGLSYYGGIYNTYRIEGERVDEKHRFNLFVFDYHLELNVAELKGEFAYNIVELQDNLQEMFGDKQWGGHLDIIVPVWRPYFFSYDEAVWNLNVRLERVDFNMGRFSSTGARIYDETNSVTGGISFRPTPSTVFRFNYMRNWHKDLFGNPAVETAGVQLGFATYF